MKRAAIALVIFFACGCAGYAQEASQSPPPNEPVRVDAKTMKAKLTHEVLPKYPQDAKDAHVMGIVVLSAVIAKDGSVKDLQVISGPPMLLKAATKAVKKWKYEPTLLNGEPVEVKTTVSVAFSLS